MEIVQSIITVACFLGLGVYQHYKIKTLKAQTTAQSELLENIKIFVDIVNPELMKYRLELYEQTLEKEKNFEITQIQQEFSKKMAGRSKVTREVFKYSVDTTVSVVGALTEALFLNPHEKRITIIDKIENETIREALKKSLPKYEEFDRRYQQVLINTLLSGNSKSEEAPTAK